MKREPTGPRLYVQHHHGKQGHIVDIGREHDDAGLRVQVQWYTPGTNPVWRSMDTLTIITADQVDRCDNGQTGEECSEIDPCEACQQDIDAVCDAIEGGMDL